MPQNHKTINRVGVGDSLSTEISQSAEYLGSLTRAFSNAQAKSNLQNASAGLATAAASLSQNIETTTNSKTK